MTRLTAFALSYLGAVLCIAFVIDRWLNRHQKPPSPPAWDEPSDGVQPADPRPVYLAVSSDPRLIGTDYRPLTDREITRRTMAN